MAHKSRLAGFMIDCQGGDLGQRQPLGLTAQSVEISTRLRPLCLAR